ncbi:DUF6221 family protein [Streptomyces sp. NPDC087525]|uniref:DUF6221 family protein n=1 Tax=Streptomyces sp. NPDC087525 TaxID=3365793 RepID=UPI0037FAA0E7
MDDLVAFLRDQLDEDEQIARTVEDRSAPWDGQWVADGDSAVRTHNGHVLFYGHGGPLKPGLAEHVVRHDPARVLRETGAKRQIVEDYATTARLRDEAAARIKAAGDSPGAEDLDVWDRAQREAGILEGPVRLLATVYADHPGYREEWRP